MPRFEIPGYAKLLLTFRVLHDGWEMDNEGRVYEGAEGKRFLVLTNHGGEYRAELSALDEKIAEYKAVLADSEKARALLLEGTARD